MMPKRPQIWEHCVKTPEYLKTAESGALNLWHEISDVCGNVNYSIVPPGNTGHRISM